MKRFLASIAAGMLLATPGFAMPGDSSASQSATMTTTQTNVIHKVPPDTIMDRNTLVNQNGNMNNGVVENTNGRQTNVINEFRAKENTMVNQGGNMRNGGVYNGK